MAYVLVCIHGAYRGSDLFLPTQGRLVIGRGSHADITLQGEGVSRQHVALVCGDGDVFVEDLGSRHGVFVNSTRVESRARMYDGDHLKIEAHLFKLRWCDVDAAIAPDLDAGFSVLASEQTHREALVLGRPGRPTSIGLSDLLELCRASHKSYQVMAIGREDVSIQIVQGKICDVTCGELSDPVDAFMEMLMLPDQWVVRAQRDQGAEEPGERIDAFMARVMARLST